MTQTYKGVASSLSPLLFVLAITACAPLRRGGAPELAGTPSSTGCDAEFEIGGSFARVNDLRFTLMNRSTGRACLATRVLFLFAAVIFATGWFVLLTAARVLPQVGPDFEGIPAPLEKAVDATDLIAQARLISLANKTYPVTVIGPNGPQPSSLPTTVFTVQVIKWLKRAPHAQYKEARLEFRKVGFTADDGRGPSVDPRFPMLSVGHQYVFLLTPNQDNVVWLAYSVQGVFEERDATVWIRDPLSPLAKRWNGAPWNEFIKAIENRVTESNRRLQPSSWHER